MFRWIIIGVGFITVVLVAFIGFAYFFPGFREATRDIAIVLLAALNLIGAFLSVALLIALLYAVNQINKLAKGSVMPKIDQAMVKLDEVLDNTRVITTNVRDSASTATTTTIFVAERVASPVIRLASLVTGVRAAATALARRDKPNE